MTWKDLKILTLQKVFAINDGRLKEDDTTREYLTAMPGAANEGLELLVTAGRFLKRHCEIHQGVETEAEETGETGEEPKENGEKMIRAPLRQGYSRYDLMELLGDFYNLDSDGVAFQSPGGTVDRRTMEWFMEAGRVLVLPGDLEGVWSIWYNAYPPELTAETEDDYVLPLYPEVAALLPLYMASQLYKDDDISIATQYRNEFEVGRDALRDAAQRGTRGSERWRCKTGWWEW